MLSKPHFFIAGTIQGSLQGIQTIGQEYRQRLRAIIIRQYPNAVVSCPEAMLRDRLSKHQSEIRGSYSALSGANVIIASQYDSPVKMVTEVFQELVCLTADTDILIAYLPGHQASMGTAMEMWHAFQNKKIIITISDMRQNLAIISTSTVIVPDIEGFERLLTDGWLDRQLHGVAGPKAGRGTGSDSI